MTLERKINRTFDNICDILPPGIDEVRKLAIRKELVKLTHTTNELFGKLCREGDTDECLSLLKYITNDSVKTFGFDTACRYGHLETAKALKSALSEAILSNDHCRDAMTSACHYGRLSVAKWLYSCGYVPRCPQTSFQINCREGNLEMVEWLLEMYTIDRSFDHYLGFKVACAHGRLAVAKRVAPPNPQFEIDIQTAYQGAIKGGHINVTDWLFEVFPSVCTSLAVYDLISLLQAVWKCKHWTMATWLLDKYPMLQKDNTLDVAHYFAEACASGNLELAKWLEGYFSLACFMTHPSLIEDAFSTAVRNDRLDVAKWLLTYGIEDKTIRELSKLSTETAKWLRQLFDISAESTIRFRIKLISASN